MKQVKSKIKNKNGDEVEILRGEGKKDKDHVIGQANRNLVGCKIVKIENNSDGTFIIELDSGDAIFFPNLTTFAFAYARPQEELK